jgi:hypothetical protein
MERETDLIIGMGEIGTSVYNLFLDERSVSVTSYDKSFTYPIENYIDTEEKIRILHICIPYSDSFVKIVKEYQKKAKPKYTVIHSTVPIGTSKKCNAIHSPVVGIHPHLTQSLKTFKKFFGGPGASDVADMFKRVGVHPYVTDKSETTELMKILCTTNYGMNIEFTKEAKRLCDANGVPFEIFTIWNQNYNDGYEKLGYPEYHRYNLVPLMKKIGGHCVIPNYSLLKSKFTEFLKSLC